MLGFKCLKLAVSSEYTHIYSFVGTKVLDDDHDHSEGLSFLFGGWVGVIDIAIKKIFRPCLFDFVYVCTYGGIGSSVPFF